MPDFIYEAEGALSTLKFNRKDVRNAINEEIMQGLSDTLRRPRGIARAKSRHPHGCGRGGVLLGRRLEMAPVF